MVLMKTDGLGNFVLAMFYTYYEEKCFGWVWYRLRGTNNYKAISDRSLWKIFVTDSWLQLPDIWQLIIHQIWGGPLQCYSITDLTMTDGGDEDEREWDTILGSLLAPEYQSPHDRELELGGEQYSLFTLTQTGAVCSCSDDWSDCYLYWSPAGM